MTNMRIIASGPFLLVEFGAVLFLSPIVLYIVGVIIQKLAPNRFVLRLATAMQWTAAAVMFLMMFGFLLLVALS